MKFLPVLILANATLLGGCASNVTAPQTAASKAEESYVALGSNIPRKGKRSDLAGVNLQELDNARTMNGASLGGRPVKQ